MDFASVDEVDRAVAAATAAFPAWRAMSLSKRTEILFRIRNLVEAHRKEIAALLTAEHGKVPADALGEVARGIENLEFACGMPQLLKGGFSEQVSSRRRRLPDPPAARRRGRDHPVQLPGHGPDVDVRQRPRAAATRSSSSRRRRTRPRRCYIAELLAEAGVPDGVFNVVQGDKVAVDRLLEHPDIAAVSFVGSTPIARYIYETGTRNGKRVQALGGAKNHMIVLPDADVDMAADAAVSAGYGSAGERCMAISVGRRGRRRGRPARRGDLGPAAEDQGRPRLRLRRPRWARSITREHRDKVAGYLDSGAGAGRDGRGRRARAIRVRAAPASSWARR